MVSFFFFDIHFQQVHLFVPHFLSLLVPLPGIDSYSIREQDYSVTAIRKALVEQLQPRSISPFFLSFFPEYSKAESLSCLILSYAFFYFLFYTLLFHLSSTRSIFIHLTLLSWFSCRVLFPPSPMVVCSPAGSLLLDLPLLSLFIIYHSSTLNHAFLYSSVKNP